MTREELKIWIEKHVKPKHAIEKQQPLLILISEICKLAKENGEMPKWMIRGILEGVAASYTGR